MVQGATKHGFVNVLLFSLSRWLLFLSWNLGFKNTVLLEVVWDFFAGIGGLSLTAYCLLPLQVPVYSGGIGVPVGSLFIIWFANIVVISPLAKDIPV